MKKGFTLIELLIVIAIIGILAVALVPSIIGAPVRARDAARKATLSNAITAIEAFQADTGALPAVGTGNCLEAAGDPLEAYFPGKSYPTDPSSPRTKVGTGAACDYVYGKVTSGGYFLAVLMEDAKSSNANKLDSTGPTMTAGTGATNSFYAIIQ